jgi:hypothetical protein
MRGIPHDKDVDTLALYHQLRALNINGTWDLDALKAFEKVEK